MAKNLAKLLKTQMPSSPKISDIAELVRKHGRGRDTVLAHITPKEAALLKARGGRGSRNPHTGLLEFDDFSGFMDTTPIAQQPADFTAPTYTPDVVTQAPTTYTGPDYSGSMGNIQTVQDGNLYQTPIYNTFQQPYQVGTYAPSFTSQASVSPTDYTAGLSNQYAGNFLSPGVVDARTLLVPQQDTNNLPAKTTERVMPLGTPSAPDTGAGITPSADLTSPSSQYAGSSDQQTVNELMKYNMDRAASGLPPVSLAQYQQTLQGISGTQAQADLATAGAYGPTTQVAAAPEQGFQAKAETPTAAAPDAVAQAQSSASSAAQAVASTGNQQAGLSAAIQSSGIDVSKLSTADLTRLNTLQQAVTNGTMTVDQANQAIQQLANNQSFSGQISNWLSQPANALKLALGIGGAAFGFMQYNNQLNQAKQVQAQIQAASANAASQLKQLAQPILSQVNYGPTASDIQNIQAAQAQAAQSFAGGGSVSAAQQQRAIQDYVTRIADNRMQQNLQLFGDASPYLTSAINTNLQGTLQGLKTSLGMQQQAAGAAGNFAAGLARLFV